MAKNKISEWSNVPSNNTDVGDINIAEGCAPSNINNALREIMAQVKDMQTGADADNFVVGGAMTCTGAAVFSSTVSIGTALAVTSGGTGLATLAAGDILYASGANTLAKLATASTTTSVLLSGNTAPTWGKVALASAVSGTLPVANGGTGQTSASAAINALVPTQTSNSGKYLKTDGTSVSWEDVTAGGVGTVTSVASGNGMNFTTITGTGTVTMGTPSTLTSSTSNAVTATSHTHAVTFPNTITSVNGASTGAITVTYAINASAEYGAVGTYAFLALVNTAGIIEGGTYAGADLRPAGLHTASTTFQNDTTASTDLTNGSTALSGTWKAMGRSNASTATRYRATLFLRIS